MVIVKLPGLVEGEDDATDRIRRAETALNGWWRLHHEAEEEPGREDAEHGSESHADLPWW